METSLEVKTIGANIREARRRAGYDTGKAFAEAIGVDASRVSEWENDTYRPSLDTILRVAKFLRVSVDDLLAGVDPGYDRALESATPTASGQALLDRILELTGAPPKPRKRANTAGTRLVSTRDEAMAEVHDLAVALGRLRTGDDAGEFVDVSGSVPNDLPVIGEGEATPKGALFWDDDGRLLPAVADRIRRPFDVRDPHAYGVKVRGDSMIPVYEPGMVVVVSPARPVRSGHRVYVELASGERLVKVARKAGDGWMLESANPAYPPRFVKRAEVRLMHRIVWVREPEDGEQLVDETTGRKVRRHK